MLVESLNITELSPTLSSLHVSECGGWGPGCMAGPPSALERGTDPPLAYS